MPELYPEDQARVDQVLSHGIYNVERKSFRPWLLLAILFGVLAVISLAGYLIAVGFDVI
jgi:hypothetical protein